MEGRATVRHNNHQSDFKLTSLRIAQIAADAHGFYNLDLKDNDIGHYTIVAYSESRSVTVRGKTIEAAVERLLERFGF